MDAHNMNREICAQNNWNSLTSWPGNWSQDLAIDIMTSKTFRSFFCSGSSQFFIRISMYLHPKFWMTLTGVASVAMVSLSPSLPWRKPLQQGPPCVIFNPAYKIGNGIAPSTFCKRFRPYNFAPFLTIMEKNRSSPSAILKYNAHDHVATSHHWPLYSISAWHAWSLRHVRRSHFVGTTFKFLYSIRSAGRNTRNDERKKFFFFLFSKIKGRRIRNPTNKKSLALFGVRLFSYSGSSQCFYKCKFTLWHSGHLILYSIYSIY